MSARSSDLAALCRRMTGEGPAAARVIEDYLGERGLTITLETSALAAFYQLLMRDLLDLPARRRLATALGALALDAWATTHPDDPVPRQLVQARQAPDAARALARVDDETPYPGAPQLRRLDPTAADCYELAWATAKARAEAGQATTMWDDASQRAWTDAWVDALVTLAPELESALGATSR